MAIVRVRCRKEPGMFRAAIYWPSTVSVREVDEDVLAKIKAETLLDVIELDDWPEDHRPTPEAAPEQPPATRAGEAPPVENEPEREVGATSNAAPVSEPEPESQSNEQPDPAPRRRR